MMGGQGGTPPTSTLPTLLPAWGVTFETAKVLADPSLAAKKLGEEAIEAVIAATKGDHDNLAAESADLIYHWLVVLAASDVSLDEVAAKLAAREGTSGLVEKASRKA